MVLQKRLDYGFNGYQVPATPRAPRSARRRTAFKKKGEDNQVCPFDLLAAVAGKLLLEGGNSSSSSNNASGNGDQSAVSQNNVKKEPADGDQTVKEETRFHENAQKEFFVSDILPKAHQMQSFKGSLSSPKDLHFGSTSVITTSDSSERFGTEDLMNRETKNEMGSLSNDCNRLGYNDEGKMLGDVVMKDEHPHIGNYNSQDYESSIPQNFLPVGPDDVALESKVKDDDDEKFSAHAHNSNATKSFRSTPRIGDRRIRKILASKHWTVSSKPKDTTASSSDVDLKPGHCSRKNYYRNLWSERNYPIKKRRYFDCYRVSESDEGANNEELPGSSQKDSAILSSIAGNSKTFQARDSHVKLRIKSFRVPELFIEIPETATVGSLKRTVLEAVTTIIGGGLRIGVLVQGKKVRDDNKTLLQTGISQESLSDALGFCLEPNPSQSLKPLHREGSNFLIPCNIPQVRSLALRGNHDFSAKPNNLVESDIDSTHSLHRATADRSTTKYSQALVPVHPLHAGAITVIPPRKSKRNEVAQRRIRRPFSVAEVEALVLAVEKLGTGRWRDVKLQAFDNAKHRTYVDLKDKWKTLVHTARISPQQRRGEPVPQELLDRVLTAHAFWSQQQGKHHQLLLESQSQQRQRPESRLGF